VLIQRNRKDHAMNGLIAGRPRRFDLGLGLALVVGVLVVGCGVQKHLTAPETGSAGTTGAAATTGAAGTIGTAGTTGTAGTSGEAGISGEAGTTGEAGTSGEGGSTVVAGRGGTGSGARGGTGGGTAGVTGAGGSATSGPGVMINGKFVPKDKAIVIIHIGHSNMRGQASGPSSLRSYFYNTQDGLWSYKGSFTLAKEPTAPEGTMTLAGPGMAILHSAQMALQAGSDAQVISIGYGKGSLTTVDYAKSGSYYPIFMNWAQQLKGNVTFAGVVIMLGITDGEHLPTNQVPGFPSRVAQIVADIRSDLGEPNLPVLFCDYEQMATGTLAPTGSVGKVMQPLVRMLPGMIPNLVLVPTDGLEMQDDHHFDMQGHKDWAARVVMLMQSNGWWKW
jgi:Carbohydrate esterase, sialic acid-specific acetylesterase